MLILNPTSVVLGSLVLLNVSAIAIDRAASRQIIEWSDDGPHIVFVDCPEHRITITLTQELSRGELTCPPPGSIHLLSLYTSIDTSHAGWSRVSVPVVVLAVKHESKPRGFVRTFTLVATSTDGATDPVTITPIA